MEKKISREVWRKYISELGKIPLEMKLKEDDLKSNNFRWKQIYYILSDL